MLNNTGSSGGLTVTGDGGASSNHSGGQILGSSGVGVSLNSTSNVSLGYLDIKNGADDGIHGNSVNNFTLDHANVLTNGNSTTDNGIQFGEDSGNTVGVTGTFAITNSAVSGNAAQNVHIRDTSGTISSFTVTNSSFNDLNDTTGANSFLLEASGTSIITSGTFSGDTFQNNSPQRGLEIQAHDTANIGTSLGAGGITVSGNTFIDNGIQASFTQDGSANLVFKFLNNGTVAAPMTGSILQAVNVFSSAASTGGTTFGTIQGNHIGNAAVANSGSTQGGGISAVIQGETKATLLIDGNVINQTNGDARGIDAEFRGPTSALAQVTDDVTVTNNSVTPGASPSGFPAAAIFVGADNQSGSDASAPLVRADIHGNTVPAGNGAFDFGTAFLEFAQFTGAGANGKAQLVGTNANATTQLQNTNTGSSQAINTVTVIPGPIGLPPLQRRGRRCAGLLADAGRNASDPGRARLRRCGGNRTMGRGRRIGRPARGIDDRYLQRGRSLRQHHRRAIAGHTSSSTPTPPATAGSSIRRRTTIRNSPTPQNAAGTDLLTDPVKRGGGPSRPADHRDARTGSRARAGRQHGGEPMPTI